MRYFELEFSDRTCMCVKGLREPTVEEANECYKVDVEIYSTPIIGVYELNREYAIDNYDFDNEANWKIFK